MLPKQYRLSKELDFQRVYKKGQFCASQFFRINSLQDNRVNKKIGVVISKNVAKKATQRNLIKRQIRQIIYDNLEKIKAHNKIIISVKKIPDNFICLKEDLSKCLKKSALI